MASTQKAMELSLQVADKITKQVASTLPIVTSSFDANGNPVVTFSADATPATGEKVVVMQVRPAAAGVGLDVFGNTQNTYAPHVIAICTEANYAATTDNVADILTPVELLPVLAEVCRCGTIVEWHVTNNGTVPSAAAIVAGTSLKATWRPLYWSVQAAV